MANSTVEYLYMVSYEHMIGITIAHIVCDGN